MRRALSCLPWILALVAPFWATQQALAQYAGVHVVETAKEKALRITVSPAAEARPALRYQLLPEFLDRRPGNAAVDYGKVTAEQNSVFANDQWWEENYRQRIDAPLAELRGVKFELPTILQNLDRAARREYCDWQLPTREGNFYAMLIPEIQEMRSFARILAVRARIQIANGQFDEAVHTLQTGYAVGQHAAEGPTLIHALIGMAVSHMMSKQVQELIRQPDAPNLYWGLTMLPRPLISAQRGIEAEMNAIELTFSEFRDLDDPARSPEYWRESLDRFWQGFAPFTGDAGKLRGPLLTALTIDGYPMAKQALIQRGRAPEEVEAMPVPQVVLLYTMQTYEELRDDMFKWWYVPYPESREGMDRAEDQLKRSRAERREIIPLAAMLLPATQAARSAVVRTDREIAVLRIIEALRMYGAAHKGRLPEKLSELAVPVPDDPVTGRPFDYKLEGETAVLEGPPLPGLLLRVEIKFAGR